MSKPTGVSSVPEKLWIAEGRRGKMLHGKMRGEDEGSTIYVRSDRIPSRSRTDCPLRILPHLGGCRYAVPSPLLVQTWYGEPEVLRSSRLIQNMVATTWALLEKGLTT